MDRETTLKLLIKPAVAVIAICLIIAMAGVSHAAEDPFEQLAETTVSYFTPMEGTVSSVSGDTLTIGLGIENGVVPGMRFNITREGAPFIHPVTKEKLGLMESQVGRAEVVDAGPNSSTLKLLNGEASEGDILRISSALVRMLFFQSSEVDWNVSEKYYETLQNTDRFLLIDTAPGTAQDSIVMDEAQRLGAEVALVLTSAKSDDGVGLTQRLLWVEDSKELARESVTIGANLLAELRLGSELFTPRKDYIISYEIPYSTSILETADMDGDGVKELIIGTGSRLSFNKTEGPLEPALGGIEYDGPNSEDIIWLDAHDLDGDGGDELVITSKRSSKIVSRIYKYKDGKLSKELEGNHFLRVIDGGLYGQKSGRGQGYSGPVFPVRWGKGSGESREALDLPPGVNIYDFSFIENTEGKRQVLAFDDSGRLNLYDENGIKTWRSVKEYGEGIKSFTKESRSPVDLRINDSSTQLTSGKKWTVQDKIHIIGRSALVIDRIPITGKAPGLGIKGSQIVGLRWIGPTFQETPMFRDIAGNIRDISIAGDRIYILARPSMGFDAKKLLKGKNPMINKLFIYSLKGI